VKGKKSMIGWDKTKEAWASMNTMAISSKTNSKVLGSSNLENRNMFIKGGFQMVSLNVIVQEFSLP